MNAVARPAAAETPMLRRGSSPWSLMQRLTRKLAHAPISSHSVIAMSMGLQVGPSAAVGRQGAAGANEELAPGTSRARGTHQIRQWGNRVGRKGMMQDSNDSVVRWPP